LVVFAEGDLIPVLQHALDLGSPTLRQDRLVVAGKQHQPGLDQELGHVALPPHLRRLLGGVDEGLAGHAEMLLGLLDPDALHRVRRDHQDGIDAPGGEEAPGSV
jgi:hypothetical protein